MIGRRYEILQLLGQGGMGQVFRVLDRLTGQQVALKRILGDMPDPPAMEDSVSNRSLELEKTAAATPSGGNDAAFDKTGVPTPVRWSAQWSEGDAVARRLALAQEFQILSTLRHPNVIAVLDYGFDTEQLPFYTMELLEGAQPLGKVAANQPLEVRLDLLIQVMRAVAYLHHRGVLHRDIKLSNIQVVPVDEKQPLRAKVLDFGLAQMEKDAISGMVSGTVAYLAPELLTGSAASVASDVYALGVVCYEVLCGRHPYDLQRSVEGLMAQVLEEAPDLSLLPFELVPVIGQALSKNPAERQKDARTLMRELAAAANFRLPAESEEVRESYLRAAHFTGREAELERLSLLLSKAKGGHGSALLLGGETGVGKSRLLDELRSVALVQGVVVLRGQGRSAGTNAYHLFEDLLRLLCLHVELHDFEAAVLGTLIPDLPKLLGREVATPPALDAQAAQVRLFNVIAGLFIRLSHAALLLLEDLHLADEASLALLRFLGKQVGSWQVLIIGSYRSYEAPQLPSQLPDFAQMQLARLSAMALKDLCGAMLGPSGRKSGLVKLIEQETAGNVYFVVEAIRALAEEAGALDDIGAQGLPTQVLSGGINEVLQRRLSRVPEAARPLLRAAAVIGQYLDLDVLQKLLPHVETLLARCADTGVLEVHEQRWRFTQEKLRTCVLEQLSVSDRQALHLWTAETMEDVYSGHSAHTAEIAYHYREAESWDAAARCYAAAGEMAFSSGALHEAATLFKEAAYLHSRTERPLLERLQVWRGLALANYGLGRLNETDMAMRTVWGLAGIPFPLTRRKLAREVLRQAFRQTLHRLSPVERQTKDPTERALQREFLQAMPAAECYAFQGRLDRLLLSVLNVVNLADSVGDSEHRLLAKSGIGFVLALTPLRRLGFYFLKLAESEREKCRGTRSEVEYLRRRAMILHQLGRHEEAAACVKQGLTQAQELHDDLLRIRGLASTLHTVIHAHDSRLLEQASLELTAMADRIDNLQYGAMGRAGLGQAFLWRREFEKAEDVLKRAVEMGAQSWARFVEFSAQGLWALCALGLSRPDLAQERALEAARQIERIQMTTGGIEFGLMALLEVCLELLELGSQPAAPLSEALDNALRLIRQLARRSVSVVPLAYIYQGRRCFIQGRTVRAIYWLRRGLRAAERLHVEYAQALAHAHLARCAKGRAGRWLLPEGNRAHLDAALALFQRSQASFEADCIAGLLARASELPSALALGRPLSLLTANRPETAVRALLAGA